MAGRGAGYWSVDCRFASSDTLPLVMIVAAIATLVLATDCRATGALDCIGGS